MVLGLQLLDVFVFLPLARQGALEQMLELAVLDLHLPYERHVQSFLHFVHLVLYLLLGLALACLQSSQLLPQLLQLSCLTLP